jgi:hypothetical protein
MDMQEFLIHKWQLDFLEKAFTYHPPFGSQVTRFQEIRDKAKEFGLLLAAFTPESVEQSQAFLHLQQVVMWANAAIAINEAE